MEQWRAMFSPTGEVTRPLNGTLAEFGDVVTPHALWGLRDVTLTRRAQSATHVEVLGSLGRHPRREKLDAHIAIVEAAHPDELQAAVARVPFRLIGLPDTFRADHALAELIASFDDLPPPTSTPKLARLADAAR